MSSAGGHRLGGRSLFGRTRSALLAILYGHAGESFYLRQLARFLGNGHGAVQRELLQLTEMGLVVRTTQGNQVLYRANARSPVFNELKSLIAKTVGIHDTLRSVLATLGSKVDIAFVYGSVARQDEQPNSDVDVMVLGDASFGDVMTALSPAQKTLGREVNPSVFSTREFRTKVAAGNHFLKKVLSEKKLFVIGTQDELAKLAAK
ncbi:MAG TPA: nucleotidyltransferase domain-containing protein [Candidatus Sulfotelmatobacter sp.]|nr:nucleotidyltransferase domain-containing protein [Candidatus Sulfotelmatobacter sp.]